MQVIRRYGTRAARLHQRKTVDTPGQKLLQQSHTLFRDGHLQAALTSVNAALEALPEDMEATVLRGEINMGLASYGEAIEDYKCAAHHKGPLAHSRIAICQSHLGLHEDALRSASLALSMDPLDGDALAIQGQIYLQKGDFEAALQPLQTCLQHHPHHIHALIVASQCLLYSNQLEDALEVAQRGLLTMEIDHPLRATASEMKAHAHLQMHQWQPALEAFDLAIELQPSSHLHLHRATAHLALGDTLAAREDIEYALQAEPNNYMAQLTYGQVLLQEGKHIPAKHALTAYLEGARAAFPGEYPDDVAQQVYQVKEVLKGLSE